MPFETQDSNGRRKVSAIITNAAGTTVDPVAAIAGGFSLLAGIRQGNFVSIDAKDLNPSSITSVLYQNNVIEKGSSAYTYQDGTARYPHLTSGEWIGNYDFLTNAAIAVP